MRDGIFTRKKCSVYELNEYLGHGKVCKCVCVGGGGGGGVKILIKFY